MSNPIQPETVGLDPICLAPLAIAHWAKETPDQTAVTYIDRRAMTYAELDEHCRRWAGALSGLGIGAGDHVALMVPNGFTAYGAWAGLGWLRSIEVPLNIGLTGTLLQYTLDNSDATTLIIAAEYVDRLAPIADQLPQLQRVIVVDGDADTSGLAIEVVDGDALHASATARYDLDGPTYRDIACIMYTSGTTGPSKGVLASWAVVYQMWSWVPEDAIAPGEALYGTLPMFHNSGKSGFTSVMKRGGHYVTRDRFSAATFWDDIRAHNCVSAAIVGPMTAFLYAQEPRPDDADNPLRSVLCGPMIPEIEDFKIRFGVKVGTCYGQTEVGAPVATTWDHGPWDCCGRLRADYPYTEVRIVDENDEPVPAGVVGEMIVRSPEPWALNVGYYKMPEKTVEAWRNGWFHTGDAFRYDDEGWIYFVDRMKDTIRRRGENISSLEVETIVGEHPDVVESAAIGVPDGYGGDEVMLCVIARPGSGLEPAALSAWLEPQMPKFMVPRYIELVDDLPRNETSLRIKKHELRNKGVTAATWERPTN